MAWDIASVIIKLINLVAMVSVIGGGFCLVLMSKTGKQVRRRLLIYIFIGACVGLISTASFFLIQIGGINQSGLSGMFDRQLGLILSKSGIGYASALRVCGYLTAMTVGGLSLYENELSTYEKKLRPSVVVLLILSVGLLSSSFSLTGHISELSLLAGISIDLHVLSMSLWIGSLYPLWWLCGVETSNQLTIIMHRFGQIALFIVALLLLSGGLLLAQLLESFSALFLTPYGQSLVVKLLGVTGLLLLAAINKFRLVPELSNKNTVIALKRSIATEMIVALFILTLTAFFTSLIGPVS